jgi:hypothetical protein
MDKHEEYYERFISEASEVVGLTREQVCSVYSYIANRGLIDYDIEKEIFYEMYDEQ